VLLQEEIMIMAITMITYSVLGVLNLFSLISELSSPLYRLGLKLKPPPPAQPMAQH
jgi:hypothetical protein